MPEGHTIHRAARDHMADLGGQRVHVRSPQGRLDVAALVDASGRARLARVEAYGKHLFYVFERKKIVHVHLGLFGKLYRRKSPPPPPRATTRMRLEGETRTIDLVGPTACDVISPAEMREITARLGPDPLRDDADPSPFFAHVARSKTPIAAVLLDQSVICGVGNVYRAEILHLLRLHPEMPASDVPSRDVREMWRLAVGLLRRGVEERRIVTTRGLALAKPREHVARAESTYVYGRGSCRTCANDVLTYTLRGRVVHYCRACQPFERAPVRRAK
ncbi:MAG: Fpg/Nei family DNA glycosylase [Deltaproteobacteria bacterium]|nr:Fpg/Nei family DNA glycosylase [Deltaproteobacteria bacterium]